MGKETSKLDIEAALRDPKAFFAEPNDVAAILAVAETKLALLRQWELDAANSRLQSWQA